MRIVQTASTVIPVALLACATTPVLAQTSYRFTVDTPLSEVRLSLETSTTLEGTFIGDYDPMTNPTGTQTRPGLFGGSGNQPIPMSAILAATGDPTSRPAGGLELDVDLGEGTMVVRHLTLDMLAGGPLAVDFVVTLAFSTFRTFNPNSLFIGVPGGIPLPIGGAETTALTGEQTTAGAGVLKATGPGEYDFTALAPLVVAGEVTALGQVFALPPTLLPVPLAGTLSIPGGGQPARMTLSFDTGTAQTLPAPPFALENVPFDLPTILPPGATAHLLINGEFGEVEIETALALLLIADGEPYCRPDFDDDGTLSIFDYLEFQNAWALMEPRGDYENDGVFDIFDFLAYQNDYARGCE